MAKSALKKNQGQNKTTETKPKLKSKSTVIDKFSSLESIPNKLCQEKKEPKVLSAQEISVEPAQANKAKGNKAKSTQNTPLVVARTQKSKSVILASGTCSKRNVPKTRKRTTIWTKFPADGEVAAKVQKPKPTSVYQQGVSYSDVLFSAGPGCAVKIKTLPADTVAEPKQDEVSTVKLEDNVSCQEDQQEKQLEFRVVQSKQEKKAARSLKTCASKVFFRNCVKDEPINNLDKGGVEPLSENFEADLPKKTNSTKKWVLPSLIDAQSSSDENANVSQQSESDTDEPTTSKKAVKCIIDSLFQATTTKEPIMEEVKKPINKMDFLMHGYGIPRRDEKCGDTFFGIQWWNLMQPDLGPEVFPRYTRDFTDQRYLHFEDLANLALKLSRGK